MKLRTLLIDDEPLAREGLVSYVNKVDFLSLQGTCEQALEAVPYLSSGTVDLLFLDIQMPQVNGLDFLKSLPQAPLTILTTAYPSYALEGYQLDVLDYLVKPITFPRFLQGAHKALKQFQLLQNKESESLIQKDHFFIKCESQYEKIRYEDILFIEAMQNYITLYTAERKYLALLTMKAIEEALPRTMFMRVHRSYIVAFDQVDTFRGHELLIGDYRVPVSRAHREAVHQQIIGGKLLS